jgi:hypothetical protein
MPWSRRRPGPIDHIVSAVRQNRVGEGHPRQGSGRRVHSASRRRLIRDVRWDLRPRESWMPVDRSSGWRPDSPDRRSDVSSDRAAAAHHGPDAATRFTETRSRATYYAELRAADNDPLGRLNRADPPPDAGTPWSAWESPELADHPDRPAPDSFRVSPERATHILDGDATGGGHRHGTGRPGKTEFPGGWTDQNIVSVVVRIARSPEAVQLQRNGRWRAEGNHDGVDIAVVVMPDGRIWTAHPLPGSPGVTQNPRNR